MIEADNLTRRFGETVAVDSVSFSIGSGEIVGLLGHNGAGKTTIMKILTGYLEPSAGSAQIDGCDVTEERAAVQANVGYLPENVPLYHDMTVLDYLEFAATVRGIPAARRRGAIREAVVATGLGDRALDVIGTLSRGYRQRVGVAQAIVHEPRFLILDEPTSGLDPGQTAGMRDLIRRLARQATIILSTHIMQEVDAVCGRVMILRAGKLALDARLADLQASHRLHVGTTASRDTVQQAVGDFARVASSDFARAAFLSFDGELTREHAAEVARRLAAAGVEFHSLQPEQRDLETVFRHVSAGGSVDV